MDLSVGWIAEACRRTTNHLKLWPVVLQKTLESPLDCKEIQPDSPKGNQSWILIGRTDAAAEAPILLPLDGKSWLTGKDPDGGKDYGQEPYATIYYWALLGQLYTVIKSAQSVMKLTASVGEQHWRKRRLLLPLLLSHVSRVRLCATPQTAAHQAPLSLGFSRLILIFGKTNTIM